MSTLKTRVTEDMKAAMRAKETARLSTIRLLLAAITAGIYTSRQHGHAAVSGTVTIAPTSSRGVSNVVSQRVVRRSAASHARPWM